MSMEQLVARVHDLETENDRLQEELEEVNHSYYKLQSRAKDSVRQAQAAGAAQSEAGARCSALQAELQALQAQLQAAEHAASTGAAERAELMGQLQAAESAGAGLRVQLQAAERAVLRGAAERAELVDQLQAAQRAGAELRAQLQAAQHTDARLSAQLQVAQHAAAKGAAELAKLAGQLQAVQHAVAEWATECAAPSNNSYTHQNDSGSAHGDAAAVAEEEGQHWTGGDDGQYHWGADDGGGEDMAGNADLAGGRGQGMQVADEFEEMDEVGVGGGHGGQLTPPPVHEAAGAEGPADAHEEPAEQAAAHAGMWVCPIQHRQEAPDAGGSPMAAAAAAAAAGSPVAVEPAAAAVAASPAAVPAGAAAAASPHAAAAPIGAAAASPGAGAAHQQAEGPRGAGAAAVLEAEGPTLRRSQRRREAPQVTLGTASAAAACPEGGAGGMGPRARPLAASITNAASASGTGPMYPRKDEHWTQWLERIRPHVVAAVVQAVVPGEQQLEAFKRNITTLELACELLAAWAQHATAHATWAAGMKISYKAKGKWADAILGRCGLHLDSLGKYGKRGVHSQKLMESLGEDILPAVRLQLQAQPGQAMHV